jgi:hypothetical protein
VYGI